LPPDEVIGLTSPGHATNINHDRSFVAGKVLGAQRHALLSRNRPTTTRNQPDASCDRMFEPAQSLQHQPMATQPTSR